MSETAELKPMVLMPPLNPTLVTDGAGLEKIKSFLNRSVDKIIGWDKETTPTKDFYWRKDRTWQIGDKTEQYVVDLLAFVDGDSDLLYSCQGEYGKKMSPKLQPVIDVFDPALCTKEFLKVGVNLGFEYEQSRWNFGQRTWNFYSVDMVERVICAGLHSLKDYDYYSLAEMMARYFKMYVDKELQTSFNLSNPLTQAQVEYAALDTRLPLALRRSQLKTIKADGLEETCKIENDAIGAFVDMHIHGQRINKEKWIIRDNKYRAEVAIAIAELDSHFLPIVGSKNVQITDAEIAEADLKWKSYNKISDDELSLKNEIKKSKTATGIELLIEKKNGLEVARKIEKEYYKQIKSELGKKRTKVNKLIDKCEGEALINYGSGAQLLAVFAGMKGLKSLKDTEDDTLEKFKNVPVIASLQKFRKASKQVSTYGIQWTQQWATKPCNEEGWLHPGDGRLHSKFNQLEAETGRSSSSQPNGQNLPKDKDTRSCFIADSPDEEEPEGYCLVTGDMAGAELRILAELSEEKVWLEAFLKGQDVHEVCAEMMYPAEWPGWAVDGCAFYKINPETNEPFKFKCDCPIHKEKRDEAKVPNFLIPYGGGPPNLAAQTGKTIEEAKAILAHHKESFPTLWKYLDESGKMAKLNKESRSMYGRRRLFPDPTWELAIEKAKDDREKQLKLPKEEADKNVATFLALHNRKPTSAEKWFLVHRMPNQKEIANAYAAMFSTIERRGKNHAIQASNADIIKLAMGCGHDKNGKPYLWHIFPKLGAKLIAMIHDELLIQVPKRNAALVVEAIGDAFKRAAAEKFTKIAMEFDSHVSDCWTK
jgi:DNA polymerase I-like protein with 3'-5' exonuclease and polymerase domains